MTEFIYIDGSPEEQQLKVGDKVNIWGDVNPDADEMPCGIIMRIDEPDVDYNDDTQRAEQYGPYLWVQWPEGIGLDRLIGQALPRGMYDDEPYIFMFDDIQKVGDATD